MSEEEEEGAKNDEMESQILLEEGGKFSFRVLFQKKGPHKTPEENLHKKEQSAKAREGVCVCVLVCVCRFRATRVNT